MCHLPLSNKGWLRQLRPNARPKAISRFECFVEQFLTVWGRDHQSLNRARVFAFRKMGYCDAE